MKQPPAPWGGRKLAFAAAASIAVLLLAGVVLGAWTKAAL